MEGARFLVPLLPALVVLTVIGLPYAVNRRALVAVVLIIIVLQLRYSMNFAAVQSTGTPFWVVDKLVVDFSIDEFPWVDRVNRVHLRDIPAVRKLDSVLSVLEEDLNRPVRIMSSQAGMIAYYTATQRYKEFEFFGMYVLATDHLTAYQVTNVYEGNVTGHPILESRYFRLAYEIEEKCDIEPPDTIYNLSGRNGYTVVYLQTGIVRHTGRVGFLSLEGGPVGAGQYIAVRNDLAGLFTGLHEQFDWGIAKGHSASPDRSFDRCDPLINTPASARRSEAHAYAVGTRRRSRPRLARSGR